MCGTFEVVISTNRPCLLSPTQSQLNFLHFPHDYVTIFIWVSMTVCMVFAIHCNVSIGGAILVWLIVCNRKPVALNVSLHPEVGEEEEEEDAIHPDQMDPEWHLVVALLHEIILADVNGDQNKLGLENKMETNVNVGSPFSFLRDKSIFS